jgi:hypothetical protein
MNLREAETIARLIGYADGGCGKCVFEMVDHANRLFPEFLFSIHDYGNIIRETMSSREFYGCHIDNSGVGTGPYPSTDESDVVFCRVSVEVKEKTGHGPTGH